jgi:riboflavin synthase
MFTGLIQTLGTVSRIESEGAGKTLLIAAPLLVHELTIGESVAVNGACLTVVQRDEESCSFQAGPETLRRTNLGTLAPGDRVNLERALRLNDRVGGHLVQGHVDGIGRIQERQTQGEWDLVWFSCPAELAGQMVAKGSVAVDGVSLTLVDVSSDRFSIALIPHTLANTSLGFKKPGALVNLETDLLAKYVFKYLTGAGLTRETLQAAGFIPEPG